MPFRVLLRDPWDGFLGFRVEGNMVLSSGQVSWVVGFGNRVS